MSFDLILRRDHVATASEVFNAYIGIDKGGRLALAEVMAAGSGTLEIDAADSLVTPRSIDSNCHIDQPMSPSMRMAADFDRRQCMGMMG